MNPNDLKRFAKIEERLYQYAEEYGLKFCPIEWDIIPDQKMFEIMSYRIPGNISNWKYGRDYERIRTINEHVDAGLPYEVVINSDPSRAYLMKTNTFGVQCLVMAHVIGHVAFFTMNKYFENTDKNILMVMSAAAERFQEYEKMYGIDDIERIVDAGHALQFHSSPFDTETEKNKKLRFFEQQMRKDNPHGGTSEFRDITNTQSPEKVREDIQRHNQKLWRAIQNKTPIEPCGDILRYVIDNSSTLEDWERDILEILRKEGQYFWPQISTKFMNEGFATYWHEKMVKRLYMDDLITNTEHAEFNYANALVKAKHKKAMNPYLIGSKIWEDIVTRWDKGQHGLEYDNCLTYTEKEAWDKKDMKGHEKMFEVVRSYQDWFFMQDFLTEKLVEDLELFIFVQRETHSSVDLIRTDHDFKAIRDLIVSSFAHSHIPKVEVIDTNYEDAGKLYLQHRWAGADLLFEYAKKTLVHIQTIWGREVILDTIINKKHILMKIGKDKKITFEEIKDHVGQGLGGDQLQTNLAVSLAQHMQKTINFRISN